MTLNEAKKIIFEAKPEFAKLYKEYGDKAWIEYAKENYLRRSDCPKTERQTEFLTAFENVVSPLLGKEKTNRAIQTLKENSLVSSADHHGVLCHPFFSNASLIRSHPKVMSSESSVISLTCGCISLTNSSYPRGIFFHDLDLKEVRMPFATLRGRRRSLYGLQSISKTNIQKQIEKLHHINISEKSKTKLKNFLSEIIQNQKVFEQKYFSGQLTIINDILWSELFDETRGNLVYLEIETLVRELILNNHLDTETTIHKIIFDEETRNKYLENFEGVVGAHNNDKKGSHIFWYIDEVENTRKQLFINKNNLETVDKKISISLSPDSIRKNLIEYRLLPSMAFCYSLISFYYGITLGGGFSQIQYLGDMKEAFKKTIGEDIMDTKTNIFTGEQVLITIGNNGDKIPASLIDILLYDIEDLGRKIDEEIENIKISDTLDMMMPEFIEIVTGKREKID